MQKKASKVFRCRKYQLPEKKKKWKHIGEGQLSIDEESLKFRSKKGVESEYRFGEVQKLDKTVHREGLVEKKPTIELRSKLEAIPPAQFVFKDAKLRDQVLSMLGAKIDEDLTTQLLVQAVKLAKIAGKYNLEEALDWFFSEREKVVGIPDSTSPQFPGKKRADLREAVEKELSDAVLRKDLDGHFDPKTGVYLSKVQLKRESRE